MSNQTASLSNESQIETLHICDETHEITQRSTMKATNSNKILVTRMQNSIWSNCFYQIIPRNIVFVVSIQAILPEDFSCNVAAPCAPPFISKISVKGFFLFCQVFSSPPPILEDKNINLNAQLVSNRCSDLSALLPADDEQLESAICLGAGKAYAAILSWKPVAVLMW